MSRFTVDGPIRDGEGLEVVTITAREAAAIHRPLARVLDLVDARDGGVLHPVLRELRARIAKAAAEFREAEAMRSLPAALPASLPLEQGERGRATSGLDEVGTLVDVKTAAELIGCHGSRVRALIAEGDLSSFKNRGRHEIPLDEVLSYRDERSRHKRAKEEFSE